MEGMSRSSVQKMLDENQQLILAVRREEDRGEEGKGEGRRDVEGRGGDMSGMRKERGDAVGFWGGGGWRREKKTRIDISKVGWRVGRRRG